MMKEFNIKDALATNKHALDDEWLRQPSLMDKATSVLSNVEYERDRAKARLSYQKAKLAVTIRDSPDEYNIQGTVTDGKVKELVACDDEIYELEKKLHEWEEEVTAADGVKWAVGQRKNQLEDLTKLFLSGYWAKPYVSNESREEIKESSESEHSEALQQNVRMKKRAKLKEK